MEAASRAYLLAEAGIGAKTRVARYMTERLYSTAQMLRLPGIPANAAADMTNRRNGILAEGDRLGFKKISKQRQPPALEEERAGNTTAIKRLLAEDDPDLGGLVYGDCLPHTLLWSSGRGDMAGAGGSGVLLIPV